MPFDTPIDYKEAYKAYKEGKLEKTTNDPSGMGNLIKKYSLDLSFLDRNLIDSIRNQENPHKYGYKQGKFYPYKETKRHPETGKTMWSIGYGHLIGTDTSQFKEGITEEQANKLMEKDVTGLVLNMRKSLDNHPEYKGKFDTLGVREKQMLLDMAYTLGPDLRNEYPNFVRAVFSGDRQQQLKESVRHTRAKNNPNQMVPLKKRNSFFVEKFFGGIPHEIKKGQTLEQVATKYKIPIKRILDWNPQYAPSKFRRLIKAGDVLVIPPEF